MMKFSVIGESCECFGSGPREKPKGVRKENCIPTERFDDQGRMMWEYEEDACPHILAYWLYVFD